MVLVLAILAASRAPSLVAICAVGLAGCIQPLGILDGSRPFQPPASWATWWAQDEACSSVTGDWRRIAWYTLSGDHIVLPDGQDVWGAWHAPDEIFLAADRITGDSAATAKLVRHEMLHDLLHTPTHPPAFAACGLAY